MAIKEESPGPDTAPPIKSVKRKSSVEELQVDLSAPEPPSKRARRALKKGKALPKKPASDYGQDGADTEVKDEKPAPRSEHGIWVGNLPFTVTATELRKWLMDNAGGVITDKSMTRIKLPVAKGPGRDKTQQPVNKGFAYVDFAGVGEKVAAIALSETELGGRRLLIKDATSFKGRPAKEKEPADASLQTRQAEQGKNAHPSRKIFVGNLSFETTEDDVVRHFEKCGEIEWAKIATFEDTGKCKGFGWVKFKEPQAAAWAVKGYVKLKEEVETEADFDAEGGAEPQTRQFKTRKWWVNRLLGRELKLELAEDEQTRYKKRFGKNAKRKGGSDTPHDKDDEAKPVGDSAWDG